MSQKKSSSPSRTRVPRPDELSQETFEFIAAIDEFKRTHMVSVLGLEQVLDILDALGYLRPESPAEGSELEELERAIDRYKESHDRLFPNWSEVFQVVLELGYERRDG